MEDVQKRERKRREKKGKVVYCSLEDALSWIRVVALASLYEENGVLGCSAILSRLRQYPL